MAASVRHTGDGDGLGRLMLPDVHLKPIEPVTLFIELKAEAAPTMQRHDDPHNVDARAPPGTCHSVMCALSPGRMFRKV